MQPKSHKFDRALAEAMVKNWREAAATSTDAPRLNRLAQQLEEMMANGQISFGRTVLMQLADDELEFRPRRGRPPS